MRDVLAFDQRPIIQQWAQCAWGQLSISLLAALALWPHLSLGEIGFALGSAMFIARRDSDRSAWLLMATWVAAFLSAGLGWTDLSERIDAVKSTEGISGVSAHALAVGSVAVCGLWARLCLGCAARWPKSVLARRPLLSQLALMGTLICVVGCDVTGGWPRLIVWSWVLAWAPYVWFMPYAITQARSGATTSLWMPLGQLRAFWSPTYFAVGKLGPYLDRHLGKTAQELAVTQLKGVKLLLWASAIHALHAFIDRWVAPEFPALETSIDAWLAGHPYPVSSEWTSLLISNVGYSLDIAMWLNLFVGMARLAGYRLPRASWRPLESKTLLDYFNRFNFYFKEMLVDLFFIPTFFKFFKSHPRLRMFFATFMAAGVGNALWHFCRDLHLIHQQGWVATLHGFTSYLFYCLVLATGIAVSQVRITMGIKPPTTWSGRIKAVVLIWTFVTLLRLFSDLSLPHSLLDRLSFLTSLFGCHP